MLRMDRGEGTFRPPSIGKLTHKRHSQHGRRLTARGPLLWALRMLVRPLRSVVFDPKRPFGEAYRLVILRGPLSSIFGRNL
jgi:hypothetical protein